jgi:hypothetical protein
VRADKSVWLRQFRRTAQTVQAFLASTLRTPGVQL